MNYYPLILLLFPIIIVAAFRTKMVHKKVLGKKLILKFPNNRHESDTGDHTVKLGPQIKENEFFDPLDEFTLCLKFNLFTSTPQRIFSSSRLSFWIDSIEKRVAVVRFGDKYEILIPHPHRLFTHSWHNVCIDRTKIKGGNKTHVNLRVRINYFTCVDINGTSDRFALARGFIEDLELGGLPSNISHSFILYPFVGMMTDLYCASKFLRNLGKTPFGRYIFDWNSRNLVTYSGQFHKFFYVPNIYVYAYKMIRKYVLSDTEESYQESCFICSFLNGVVPSFEKINTKNHLWTSFHKTEEECVPFPYPQKLNLNDLAWEIGEPNGLDKQQCIAVNTITKQFKDEYCLAKHKFLCFVILFKTYSLRGLPAHSLHVIDHNYILQYADDEIRFYGVEKNLIQRHSENSSTWILTYSYDPRKIIAFYNGTKTYPWGVNTWFYFQDRRYEPMPLKITKCTSNEFSCNEPKCIPISSVCNDLKDCSDADDEKDCNTIEMNTYRKEFPPSMLRDGKKRIHVNIQFHLISINSIHESTGELEIRYFIQLHWKDPRLKFYHLLNDTERFLTNEEKDRIWIPPIIFDNAVKSKYKVLEGYLIQISALKEVYAKGTPNSVSFLHEKLQFNGKDVKLIYRTENNLKVFCTFNYRNYPFDTQTCNISIGLPFDLKEKVQLIVNESTRFEPIHLLQHELSGLRFKFNPRNGMSVVQITLKRLFYNIFWTTYVPTLCLQILAILTLYFHPNTFDVTIMITLTTTLVMHTLYQTVSFSLPSTAYNKMIDYWLFFSLTIPFVIFIIEVTIELSSSMSHRRKKKSPLIYIISVYGKNMVIITTVLFDLFYWIYNLDYYYN